MPDTSAEGAPGVTLTGDRWQIDIERIGDAGRTVAIAADDAERAALAAALGLGACEAFDIHGELTRMLGARFRLDATLEARVVHTCVVSLEPVTQQIGERMTIEFWPPDQIAAEIFEPDDDGDPPEPIENDRIDLGRLAYETLAVAIDPYPRKAGAAMDPQIVADVARSGEGNPFRALAGLRDKT